MDSYQSDLKLQRSVGGDDATRAVRAVCEVRRATYDGSLANRELRSKACHQDLSNKEHAVAAQRGRETRAYLLDALVPAWDHLSDAQRKRELAIAADRGTSVAWMRRADDLKPYRSIDESNFLPSMSCTSGRVGRLFAPGKCVGWETAPDKGVGWRTQPV